MLSFHPQYFFKSTSAEDQVLEKTNVLSFQVDNILKSPVQQTYDFNRAVTCPKCESIFLTSKCGVCDPDVKRSLPNKSFVEFQKEQKQQINVEQSKIIVFCIDVSGSMGGQRLDLVKAATLKTIENLRQKSPLVKVALITFTDSHSFYGDSRSVQRLITSASLNRKPERLRPINESFDDIKQAISSLQAQGGTSILNSLIESVSIGTEVVLCTDGAASDENIQTYDSIIAFAKQNSIKINIVTFDGTDCRLAVLSKFANETNGIISRSSNALEMTNAFTNISHSAAAKSDTTSFKLIFNNTEMHINDSGNMIKMNASDLLQKWLFNVKIKIDQKKEVVVQLQVNQENKVRVLTIKMQICHSSNAFSRCKSMNIDLLSLMIADTIFTKMSTERLKFQAVINIFDEYKSIYSKLNINMPSSILSLESILRKQNASLDFMSLGDKDVHAVSSVKDEFKQKIDYQAEIVVYIPKVFSFRSMAPILTGITSKISDNSKLAINSQTLADESSWKLLIKQNSSVSETIDGSLHDIAFRFNLRRTLLILKSLLVVCQHFSHRLEIVFQSTGTKIAKTSELNKPTMDVLRNYLQQGRLILQKLESTGLVSEDEIIERKFHSLNPRFEVDHGEHVKGLHQVTHLISGRINELTKLINMEELSAEIEKKKSLTGKFSFALNQVIANKEVKDEQLVKELIKKQFYTEIAVKNTVDMNLSSSKKDTFGNLAGNQFDLARDLAFKGFSIAVLQLYPFDFKSAEAALVEKGFTVHIWTSLPTIQEFGRVLHTSCQFWVISERKCFIQNEHLEAIKQFFESGKGVYIWGDNDPYYADANKVSKYLFGAEMSGNVPGGQTVNIQTEKQKAGLVKDHLINTGLYRLFEGTTIATIQNHPDLDPVMYGSANNLIIAAYDKNGKRAVMDGGFTRLFCNWTSAGTSRYVKNAAAWLVNVENRPPS